MSPFHSSVVLLPLVGLRGRDGGGGGGGGGVQRSNLRQTPSLGGRLLPPKAESLTLTYLSLCPNSSVSHPTNLWVRLRVKNKLKLGWKVPDSLELSGGLSDSESKE